MSKPKFWAITFTLVCCFASFIIFVIDIFKYKAYEGYGWLFLSGMAAIIVSLVAIIAFQNKNKFVSNLFLWVAIIGLFALLGFIVIVSFNVLKYQWWIAIVWAVGLALISGLTI